MESAKEPFKEDSRLKRNSFQVPCYFGERMARGVGLRTRRGSAELANASNPTLASVLH